MEDSSLDWEKLEDEGEVEKGSGFGWVLSKGLNLGKNLVITGVVVSSIPIIVPPLLVVSALGFAFSVPFGFMFASYTCTEKLMSKLLPASSPHVIVYGEGEVVECEDKWKGQVDDEYSEGMIYFQEELADENRVMLVEENGVIFVKENEEGLNTFGEFQKDEGGLQYEDINTSEEVLSTVSELGGDEEGLRYDDIIISEEGLSTVSEVGKDEGGLRKYNVNMSEEGLSTGTEFGKDEKGLRNDVNISEEGLGTVTELGKDEEGLQKEDINRNDEGLSTVTESGKDQVGSLKDDTYRSEEGLSVAELGKDEEGSQKGVVNMSEEEVLSGTEFEKHEQGSRKKVVNITEVGLTTVAEFGKGEEGLQKNDMNRGDTDGNRASEAVMVTGDLDMPNKEEMQYGGIDNRERSVEEIGVEVNRYGIEESRETKATDDAISQVQTIPSVKMNDDKGKKATDDVISQVQTIPSLVEMNDDESKKEVTQLKVEDKIDTKSGGEKNDIHGSKGTDKGKKRHTNAKGKKKTQKTLKRVEGDVSKAHGKDVVKPEIVSGTADIPLEPENKLNLDKNETQLPAQDVAEEKITGAIMISKDNGEPGNLITSIGDIDESNKTAGLLESETTTNGVSEPCEQASNVSVLVPVVELPDSKLVPVVIQHEESVELKDDGVHVAGNGSLKNKEMLGEEEIWKQIDSIRTIVGFKVAKHTSYFEELKALYVFTGIEPPSLFKDPLDTAEVLDKLRFLMSVIGVK